MAEEVEKIEGIYDKSKLGQPIEEIQITVTEDAMLRYANAIGEQDPKYTKAGPDLIAHPGILTVLQTPTGRVEVKFPFAKTGAHGGSSIFNYADIKAGDTLTVRSKLTDVYTKTGRSGPMGFVVHENEFIREDGTMVGKVADSMVSRP